MRPASRFNDWADSSPAFWIFMGIMFGTALAFVMAPYLYLLYVWVSSP